MRLTWYVVDLDEYRAAVRELGRAYRETIGAHYPAMAVVASPAWWSAPPDWKSRRLPWCRLTEAFRRAMIC